MFRGLDLENKVVAHYSTDSLIVDTSLVGEQTYETAVSSTVHNPGSFAVVEQYDSIEGAIIGHDKWIKIMESIG